MRRSTFVVFSFLISFALGVAAPVVAGEPRSAQSDLVDGLYLESTGHAVYIKAPKVDGLGIYAGEHFLGGPQIQFKNEGRVNDVGAGWDGRLGFKLPYVDLPSWLEGLNVELGGSYAEADSYSEHDLNLRHHGAIFTPVAINGNPQFGFLGRDQIIKQRFEGDVQIWDARIGAALDLDLADFIKSRARAGLVGGMIEQEYDISHKPTAVGPFAFDGTGFFRAIPTLHRLNEDLDSYFVGGYLGMSFEAQLTQRLSVTLDTDVSLLYNNARLDASQSVVGFYFDGGHPAPFCAYSKQPCHNPESDRDSAFGVRPRVRAGIDLDLGPFILGLSGGFTYWSYAPQVVNPRFSDAVGPGEQGEAHIENEDMLVADLGVKLTIPFGGNDMTASSATAFGTAAGEALEDLIPGLYFENYGYAAYVQVPNVEGLGMQTVDFNHNGWKSPPLDDEHRINNVGGGWEGLIGFALPGTMPYDEGGQWSVEMGGSYLTAEESANDFQALGNNEWAFGIPVNGQPRLAVIGREQYVRQTFDGEVEQWDVRLGLARDLGLVEGLGSRIRTGLVGGRLDQDYVIEQEAVQIPPIGPVPSSEYGFGGQQRLEEALHNPFGGAYLGMDFRAQLTGRLSVHLDTEVALLYSQAHLQADQQVAATEIDDDGNALCSVFNSGSAFDRCGFLHKETDVQHHFAARPRVRAGFDVDFGRFLVGVTGGATYWTYAPQVVNGMGGLSPVNPGFRTEKAHIGGDDLFVADLGVKVTIPLR